MFFKWVCHNRHSKCLRWATKIHLSELFSKNQYLPWIFSSEPPCVRKSLMSSEMTLRIVVVRFLTLVSVGLIKIIVNYYYFNLFIVFYIQITFYLLGVEKHFSIWNELLYSHLIVWKYPLCKRPNSISFVYESMGTEEIR